MIVNSIIVHPIGRKSLGGAHVLSGVITMSEQAKSENTQVGILRDAFEGMKGRQLKSDQELKEWLATDEGKEATLFLATSVSAWGDKGRS
jgi:hypothetical protein